MVTLQDTETYKRIVSAFGPSVVGPDGAIDRRVLGGLVFGSSPEVQRNMQSLTDIVWPEIRRLMREKLRSWVRAVVWKGKLILNYLANSGLFC